MANSFGSTWWGKRWLSALDNIDFDNRLPRGRRYANNGSVKAIEIKANRISAKVQGSRPTPYMVNVAIPVLGKDEKARLLSAMRTNPGIQAALLNRELSPTIDKVASDNRIALFPSKWTDLQMECSCPDWAVPCKHIAAVIYIIADNIDRNPWMYFRMKGLDVEKEFLPDLGMSAAAEIATVQTYFTSEPQKNPIGLDDVSHATLSAINLARIPDLHDPVYDLLSPSPLFWKGDFREETDDRISRLSRNLGKWLAAPSDEETDLLQRMREGYPVIIHFSSHLAPDSVAGASGKGIKGWNNGTFADLALALARIAPHETIDLDETALCLWYLFNFSTALCLKGAIRPQLVKTDDSTYRILWVPVESAPEIQDIIRTFNMQLPFLLSLIVPPKGKRSAHPSIVREKHCQVICSAFAGLFMGEFSMDAQPYYQSRRRIFDAPVPTRDPIQDLFFGGYPVSFSGLQADSIPDTIQKWLDRFELETRKWKPVLQLRTRGENFTLHIVAEQEKNGEWIRYPLDEFLEEPKLKKEAPHFLKTLDQLAGIIPELHLLLQSRGKKSVKADPKEILSLLLKRIPLIELLGVEVLLPKGLKELVRPTASIRLHSNQSEGEGIFGLDSLLSFDWQVSLGDSQMDPKEFFSLVKTAHGLVKIRNRYILIQPDEMTKIRNRFEKGPRPTSQELIQAALSGSFEGREAGLAPEVLLLVDRITQIKSLPVPKGIQASLRPYQKRGFEWMYKNSQLGLGSLIADDMGLGKTLQVITLLEKFREDGALGKKPALVVVPTSLVFNWKKETEKFAPNLRTAIFHGTARKFPAGKFDLMVTTYGTVRSDLKEMKKKKWSVVIVDEAQNIKNPDAAQSKAVRELNSAIRIAMSGTPVENRLTDYWSVFDFALPGYLGGRKQFQDQFATPISRFRDPDALSLFKSITGPFIMRRLKTDKNIISDLPDKWVNQAWCSLERSQAAIYESVVRECLEDISGMEGGIQRRGLVLKMLTMLKQVCNHPVQYLGKGKPDPALSGKSAALIDILGNILSLHEKCLIFTQYREMGALLAKMIETNTGHPALFLHGGLSRKQRDEMVKSFQEDPHRKIFILSLKAGGTGLNLTAANHVIHYDLWWNPAVENQATDRAFRIGQQKNVIVHRLLCKGTLEEKIDEMLNKKKELAELTVADGETWIGNLDDKQLQRLVTLEA